MDRGAWQATVHTHTQVGCSVIQLCPILFDAMDCGPPGFSVLGILQARILEWVAISFSKCNAVGCAFHHKYQDT